MRKRAQTCFLLGVNLFAQVCAGLRRFALFTHVYCVCAVLDTVRRGRACEGRRHAGPAAPLPTGGTRTGRPGLRRGRLRRRSAPGAARGQAGPGRPCGRPRPSSSPPPPSRRTPRRSRPGPGLPGPAFVAASAAAAAHPEPPGTRPGLAVLAASVRAPPPRRNRSRPGPGLPGPAFVFAVPAVAAHPAPEPPRARPVRPGPDRPARPPVADIKICDTMRDCKQCSGPRGDRSASARGDGSAGARGRGSGGGGKAGARGRGSGEGGRRAGTRVRGGRQGRWRRRGPSPVIVRQPESTRPSVAVRPPTHFPERPLTHPHVC
jgi:hypothetical protein